MQTNLSATGMKDVKQSRLKGISPSDESPDDDKESSPNLVYTIELIYEKLS